jgi:hypothetical protein
MQILADTACYADFTPPLAPSVAQVRKINSLYECKAPLDVRGAHRRGHDLVCGRTPRIFLSSFKVPWRLASTAENTGFCRSWRTQRSLQQIRLLHSD